jgi:transposase-like protein
VNWLSILTPLTSSKELAEAKRATEAGQEEVKELTRELRKIDEENHIAAKIHAAFRGEQWN